jgi:outer membrane protein assembly factor BamB
MESFISAHRRPILNGYLHALDASSGATIWQYQTGGTITDRPAVANNVVYFGCWDHYVYALNTDGSLKWRYQTGNTIQASPTLDYGAVYIGSNDDYFYVLDASTGALDWRYGTGFPIAYSTPAVTNEVAYVGSFTVYAFNVDNGTVIWSSNGSPFIDSSPAVGP